MVKVFITSKVHVRECTWVNSKSELPLMLLLLTESCLVLFDPVDCRPPASSNRGGLSWGVLWVSLASHLACVHIWPYSASFWMKYMHLSATMDSNAKVSGGLQDILWGGGFSLHWPLPRLRIFSAPVILENAFDLNIEEIVIILSSTQSEPNAPALVSKC